MLDLDAHQQKVDLAHNHIPQMVLGLVVLKLNVQTVLDAHLHLDRRTQLRITAQRMHGHIDLAHNVRDPTGDRDTQEVAQPDVRSDVHFVRFLDVGELKRIVGVLDEVAGTRQLLDQRQELMVIAAIKVQFDLADQVDPDALVLQLRAGLLQRYVHATRNGFAVVVEEELLFAPVVQLHLGEFARIGAVEDDVDVRRLAETEKVLQETRIREINSMEFL